MLLSTLSKVVDLLTCLQGPTSQGMTPLVFLILRTVMIHLNPSAGWVIEASQQSFPITLLAIGLSALIVVLNVVIQKEGFV